jgi:hypothetical protein
MNLQESIRRILREDKYDDKVGRIFWFEYHCYESPESCDSEIWYRSHQKVKVIGVSEWSFDDYEDRMNDGQPRVYLVEWKDGFQYDVFEDELLESPNEFYRPNPPKRKIQESIKKILREEVTKKFAKPNESLQKSVYNWLNKYFEGSQIYKHESWKHWSFRFEFCKNGREIADLHLDFDDRSPDWGPRDKRPTSERSFNNAWLYIYPDMVNLMMKVFPIRKNYLLYLIEEWFEDTKLNEIQQEFNRSDMYLDYVYVSETKKKGELCVPPVSKPEGVTMQEMMDYIKKTTLYSYEDMEEHEEEEPGWIEELYLAKLREKEQERSNQEDRENNPEPFNDDY